MDFNYRDWLPHWRYAWQRIRTQMNKDIEWTPHVIARLTELLAHPDGLSYKLIAKQMAQEFGGKFTRSSISGKIHRLRLPPGPPKKPVVRMQPPRPSVPYKPRPTQRRRTRDLQLVELERGDCKWPEGVKVPYIFCGKPAAGEGASYCKFHTKRAYVKPRSAWE